MPYATRYPLTVFLLLAVLGFWPVTQTWAQEARAKKLIYYGWGNPDTQYVRDHWRQMEEMPFDGVGIVVAVDRQAWQRGERGGGNKLGGWIMGKRSLQVEEFREGIADLKVAKWRRFTDNFLPVSLSASQSATGLNWFDEERWHIIVNNFGVLAKIAAEGSIKGLILDPEHYGYALFNYVDQRKQIDKPFDEYVKMARRRGQEVMTAIAATLPKVVVLSLFGHSLPLHYLRDGKSLQELDYSILPAFYDGLLEAMPVGASLVDGYEFAYAYKERRQFLEAYNRIHQTARVLSTVPGLYQEKVSAGFGLWLDYGRKLDHFTPEEFRQAVSAALEVSDGYVWIYSHQPRFFPPANIQPAYLEALATARRGR